MSEVSELAVVILAAGQGTRMRSRTPKVLHPVCGRPIVRWQIALARELGADRVVVVVGTGEDEVRSVLARDQVEVVRQREQLGTAHAALQAREALAGHTGPVLITYGDHALWRPATFAALLEAFRSRRADLALLTAELPDAAGYGRIVRGRDGEIVRIVEAKDATPEVLAIREGNMGVYVVSGPLLFPALASVKSDNAKREFYLTDLVEAFLSDGRRVTTSKCADWQESLGINDRLDLAETERLMRARINARWMREGVTFVDPERSYVEAEVEIGPDSVIEPGVQLRGRTRLGAGCRIAAGSVIDDSVLGDDCAIKPHCWLESATLGARCVIGPSAHLRPGARLADEVRIGNFVEVKNSSLGRGSKADHLSYVGDADVGAGVTLGCGAITVNYDGEKKTRTVIGDGAFVGCNSNLIAPVEVEANAYVAAGSTITTKVPAGALAVARERQRNIEGWRERRFRGKGKGGQH
jgi:bifunctional UDP-N-acetylglucosamine pyrophosphorylase/glucosamine-1-phosphate N-acetyltransferase